jgi:hypothetical protein
LPVAIQDGVSAAGIMRKQLVRCFALLGIQSLSFFEVRCRLYIPSVMMGITAKGRLKTLFGVFQTTFFLT